MVNSNGILAAQQMIHSLLVPLALLDRDGSVMDLNDRLAGCFAKDKETLLKNLEATTIILEKEGEPPLPLDQWLQSEKPSGNIIRINKCRLKIQDQSIYGSVHFDKITDQAGSFDFWMLTVEPETLNPSQGKTSYYKILASHLPNAAAFIVDRNFRYVHASGEAVEHAGFQPQSFEGKTLWEVLDKPLADQYMSIYSRTLDGEKQSFEHQAHGRSYISEVIPVKNSENEITHALAVSYDISDRVKLEKELNNERELFQKIFDTIPVMLTVYDPAQQMTFLNQAFTNITGWDRESGNIMDLVYPDPVYRKEISDYMQSLQTGFKDIVMRTRFGNNLETSWANVQISDGRQIGIGIDITERKKLEKTILHTNEQLRKLNELLENLLYISAHDLRSPLTNMQLLMEVIRMEEDEKEKLLYLGNFEAMIKRLESVIYGMTEILESQKNLHEPPEKLDLMEFCAHIRELYKKELAEIGGRFSSHLTGSKILYYEKPILQSIVTNLMSNSLKYRKEEVPLHIHLDITQEGDITRFAFSDNGIGIDLRKAGSQLFRPFKRFTNQSRGSGIGLYLVKYFVEKNGGYVTVNSEPGNGTTVICGLKAYK